MRKTRTLSLILALVMALGLVGGAASYTVQSGDVLWRIAEDFGTDYKSLAAANGIDNPNLIFPGQVITWGEEATVEPTPEPTPEVEMTYYTGSAQGFGGAVEVTLGYEGDTLVDVKVVGAGETAGIGTKAIEAMPAMILAAGSADVDSVAGATVTADAIKAATKAAMDEKMGVEKPVVEADKVQTATATAMGYGGNMTVEVMATGTEITSVKVTEHDESMGIGTHAIDRIPVAMVEHQSIAIDSIAGASVTSGAIKSAVATALAKMGLDSADYQTEPVINQAAIADKTFDVVVLGAGGAGLSAAIEAKLNGADSVVLVEKMAFAGGNTILSYADLAAPGNWLQVEKGIEDSAELMAQEMWEGGGKLARKEIVDVVSYNSLSAANWLKDYVGVEYTDYLVQEGGHSLPRAVEPIGKGSGMVLPLVDKAVELGVEIFYNTEAKEFVVDENGRLIGTVVERDGVKAVFTATSGTVLATGGFGANIEMREKYNTLWATLDNSVPTTNSPAITGDGIVMAEKIGAKLEGMEYVQLYPFANPYTGVYYGYESPIWSSEGFAYINQDGNRFVNELSTRKERSDGILAQDGHVIGLYNQEVADRMGLEELHAKEYAITLEQGVFYKADTLEEIAEYFDINAENLVKTMDNYNKYMEDGVDPEFGRTTSLVPMNGGPWYAMIGVPTVHHTMGGVMIDEEARVISNDNTPIDGLFAAGEVTGSVHGNNRLGTCAITDIVVFGRIAGANAAAGVK